MPVKDNCFRVTFDIDKNLYKRLKRLSVEKETTIRECMCTILKDNISKEERLINEVKKDGQ